MRGVNVVCFFFQAEDGIRGGRVTGVQTCALPISLVGRPQRLIASYACDCDVTPKPRRAPTPWTMRCNGRLAVSRGSLFRKLPDAELRGFTYGFSPDSTSAAFRSANA